MSTAGSKRPLRALVVAYDFPPHAAIGTMRTLRLVQQLAADNWDVTVLTSDPRAYRAGTPVDETLNTRVPSSVRVVRAGALRPFESLKGFARRGVRTAAAGAVRAAASASPKADKPTSTLTRTVDLIDTALAIPDHESGWFAPAVAKGLAACRGWRPDVMYSSAPPWTGQLVARQLAARLRCPWIADFRDPWARAPWREARREFVKRANIRMERAVIGAATGVLFVTRANLAEFSAHYGPVVSRRFHFVPSGCDPSDFDAVVGERRTDRFVLLHAGTLYGARNPVPLMEAIARAIQRGTLSRDTFRLRLVGPINLAVNLADECRRLGLEDVVELVPRVTRLGSLVEMVSASALLLVQPGTTVSVPGKAYEYLAAGRPIMAIAEPGETTELVQASGIGVSVQPDAGIDALESALLSIVAIASKPYAPPPVGLYDGRVHAATAAEILTEVAQRAQSLGGADPAIPGPASSLRSEESGR